MEGNRGAAIALRHVKRQQRRAQPRLEALEGRWLLAGAINEFAVTPGEPFNVFDIAPGPDGNLWFLEDALGRVGRITTQGTVTEFPVGGDVQGGIVAGADGNLWFADRGHQAIDQITPSGRITEFPVPPNGAPSMLALGPDGAIWFTSTFSSEIGRLAPDGTVTEFPVASAAGNPTLGLEGITAGPDGNVWFAVQGGTVGRITPQGAVTEFPVPGVRPLEITAGPDGNLWFTASAGNAIGRITPTGAVTLFPLPAPAQGPWGITAGPDGALWFALQGAAIGRITPGGTITEYADTAVDAQPFAITAGPDGNIWFTERTSSAIGQLVLAQALSATGASLTATTGQPLSATVATLVAPDPHATAADFSATVAWGDGTTSSARFVPQPYGLYNVTGDHTYAHAGAYTIQVTISSASGASASATSTVRVTNPAAASTPPGGSAGGSTATIITIALPAGGKVEYGGPWSHGPKRHAARVQPRRRALGQLVRARAEQHHHRAHAQSSGAAIYLATRKARWAFLRLISGWRHAR